MKLILIIDFFYCYVKTTAYKIKGVVFTFGQLNAQMRQATILVFAWSTLKNWAMFPRRKMFSLQYFCILFSLHVPYLVYCEILFTIYKVWVDENSCHLLGGSGQAHSIGFENLFPVASLLKPYLELSKGLLGNQVFFQKSLALIFVSYSHICKYNMYYMYINCCVNINRWIFL